MASDGDRIEGNIRLVAKVADGGAIPPKLLRRLERDLDRHPRDCIEALRRLAAIPDGIDDERGIGCVMLMQAWLAELRMAAEVGDPEAGSVIDEFQAVLAGLARDSALDDESFLVLTTMLGNAGVPVAPAVQQEAARLTAALHEEEFAGIDAESALAEMVPLAAADPFALLEGLAESGHAMPAEVKAAMASALAGNPGTAAAGLLLLLDPIATVRAEAARSLSRVAGRLDGVALRRLITVRNWVPEPERGDIDRVVRAARTAGVVCASWPKPEVDQILGCSPDGSGSQSLMVVARAGRDRYFCPVLFRTGVRDAYAQRRTKTQITSTVAKARREVGLRPVSRHYLDCTVCHHLEVGLIEGRPPPAGLLDVAERAGAADWLPRRLDWRALLAALAVGLPATDDPARQRMLDMSEFTTLRDPIHTSWFEDGPMVAAALSGRGRRDRGRAVERVLETIIEPAREKWAELFTWVAFGLREGGEGDADAFVVLAEALAGDAPVDRIPAMRAVAARTVEVARAR